MNHTPVYTFGLGYPPMTKTNLFTFKTQSTMKKVNEIAVINSVSLNEKLYSFNEDNETFRVALRVTYAISDSSDNKEDKDFLSLAAFADAGAGTRPEAEPALCQKTAQRLPSLSLLDDRHSCSHAWHAS